LDSSLTLSVIAGLGVGIAFVLIFLSNPMSDGNSFRPESYYGWSPEDGRWPPRIFLTEDADSNIDDIPTIEFRSELKLGPLTDEG
jgi:hypothetical protein